MLKTKKDPALTFLGKCSYLFCQTVHPATIFGSERDPS